MSNPKDIAPISTETLMAYVNGSLSAAERAAIEEQLEADTFYSDALEGMAEMGVTQTQQSTHSINKKFEQTLEKRRRNERRKRLNATPVYWQVVLVLLFLMAVAYFIIWAMKQN